MEDITIIDNYRDLSIGDYQEIVAICKDGSLEEIDKQVKMISILTGRTEDEILDLPIMEYKRLSARLSFLESELPGDKQRLADSYKIGKFDLIPVKDIRKVSTAQYIDFQSFHQAGFEEHFVEILSCLLVPKGMKYNTDYDIIEVQNAIRKEMNVYDALCLYGFFIVSCNESIKDMLIFSLQEAKGIKDREQRERMIRLISEQMTLLKTNGNGSSALT